tara:strand:- start:1 stop:177 length:177 start_codon:yes stop_codon:yes gene_type:complete
MKHYRATVVLDLTNDIFKEVENATGYDIVDGVLVITTDNSTVGYKEFAAFTFEGQESV